MSNPDTEAARVRLTLELSKRLNDQVEALAARNGTSKADIIRFAVELLSVATDAKKEGMTVGAWSDSPGKRSEREFIGL